MTWPSDARRRFPVDGSVTVAPPGTHLFGLRDDPPGLVVWPLQEDGEGERVVLDLPDGTDAARRGGPGRPVWESAGVLLVSVQGWARDDDVRALRVDVRTGRVEAVPVPEPAGSGGPVFVAPVPEG